MQTSNGVPQATYEMASTDSVQTLASAKYQWTPDDTMANNLVQAKNALIQCKTNSINFAFGADPSTSFGYTLAAGDTLELKSHSSMKKFRFISAASGVHGALTITIER